MADPKRVLQIMLETSELVAAISRGSRLPEKEIERILRSLISKQMIECDGQR